MEEPSFTLSDVTRMLADMDWDSLELHATAAANSGNLSCCLSRSASAHPPTIVITRQSSGPAMSEALASGAAEAQDAPKPEAQDAAGPEAQDVHEDPVTSEMTADEQKAAKRKEIEQKVAAMKLQQKKEEGQKTMYFGEHPGITCDGCGVQPLVGYRYKCKQVTTATEHRKHH